MGTVGIIANPTSGRDVRRLLANAARSSIADKVTIVRRVAIGAVAAGADRLLVTPDPHGLCRRALSTVHLDVEVEEVELPQVHDERDTIVAAAEMRDRGASVIVVLGGDGTNRVVAKGWPDATIVPLSTGTNNVFPAHVEPTIAGAAAGLVASGSVPRAVAARQAKVVHAEIDGQEPDIALVDAVVTSERVVGLRTPFEPSTLVAAVLAIADPAAVGISPIAGLVLPCGRDEDAAVELRMAPPDSADRVVHVPISPGLYAHVGVDRCEPLFLGDPVVVDGPGLVAFDGDRRRVVPDGGRVTLVVERDGPFVVDVPRTLAEAARRGVYVGGG
jgi:hypothetical protein